MQRMASMSVVVRAQGVSEAFYNGQRDRVVEAVRAEAEERLRAARAELEREREQVDFQRKKCSRLQKQSVDSFLAAQSRKPGLMRRIGNGAALVWAYIWCAMKAIGHAAVMVWAYFWGFLYVWGLVEYEHDDQH